MEVTGDGGNQAIAACAETMATNLAYNIRRLVERMAAA